MAIKTDATALRPAKRTLLTTICFSSLLLTAVAQNLLPSNDPPRGGDPFDLRLTTLMSEKSYKLNPLTDHSTETKATLSGTLVATDPSNVNSLLDQTIAYISCDESSYPGNTGAQDVFNAATYHSPSLMGVLLYSVNNASCTLSPNNYPAPSIYSMQDSASANEVLSILQSNTTMIQNTTISRGSNGNGGGGGILGKSPTTAVAMIILYSITGIITALFLIIIVVGAIRAHRHPERYGPRNVIGRPRQSRAKGIARAMLETIPIVKFGDHENLKPDQQQQRDVEMTPSHTIAETSNQGQAQQETSGSVDQRIPSEGNNATIAINQATNGEEQPQATSDPIANADNGLACSVCTDDFAKGQDVRVLPCNHKFHPECIDPWLLNVSGTCPLCRIDLRPTTSNNEGGPIDDPDAPPQPRRHSEALTSFAANPQSRRSSRARPLHYLHHYLNRGRMEEATPEERLEALRRLRLVDRDDVDHVTPQPEDGVEAGSSSTAAGIGGGGGNRNRLSARFSRAFGGDRSRPVSWAPPGSPTPVVPEARTEEREAGASGNDTSGAR
ncbi:MAG: hypothetical protein Q9219_001619 [cf. Caloplaca sp. 3 TL-2023]